jgi:hypothetical protein
MIKGGTLNIKERITGGRTFVALIVTQTKNVQILGFMQYT